MSFIETQGKSNVGMLVLQHKGWRAPGWDLDYRAHKRVVRVLDREDSTGAWKLDPNATGDLVLGYCWPNDSQQRQMPMWAFGFPVVLSKAKGGSVATGGGGAGATFSGVASVIPGTPVASGGGNPDSSGPMNMLPIADQKDSPDGRMRPIPAPARVIKANGAQNPPAPPPGAGGAGNNGGRVGSGSGTLYLGIGGGIGNFGGPGVGTGSGFPTFFGVPNYLAQSGFPVFSGVPNFFAGGGGSPGVSFTDPTAPPRTQQQAGLGIQRQ